jgi:hypothetical protein
MLAPVFCRFHCKYAGGFYPESAKSDIFVPALKRRKSEEEANMKHTVLPLCCVYGGIHANFLYLCVENITE